jgi:hypothetical protein
MRTALRRRVEKLEAASSGSDEVSHLEWVLWSLRPESERCDDNPAWVEFSNRFETSSLKRLFEASIYHRPHTS